MLPAGQVLAIPRGRTRGDAGRTGFSSEPVAIRTRGPIPVPAVLPVYTPLRRFVGDHRTQMANLPLVTLIFGESFETPEAPETRFATALNETLHANSDVVWVVSRSGQQLPFGAIRAEAATLDLQQDEPVWRNIVADVLFCPAASEADEKIIATFRQRAAVLIVPLSAPNLQTVGRAAAAAGIPVVGWSEEANTVEAIEPEKFWDLSVHPAGAVGSFLAKVATQLTIHDDRRSRFRCLLDQLADDGPDWPMTTIEYSHRHEWARWTIGTLPKLYVRVGDGFGRDAYLWRLIYDCVSTLPCNVAEELCDGAIVRIAAPDDVHEVIAEVDGRFQQARDRHRQVSDAMMFGQFSMALSDLVREWSGNQARSMIARHVKTLVTAVETRRTW
jgi:hypothetical protein